MRAQVTIHTAGQDVQHGHKRVDGYAQGGAEEREPDGQQIGEPAPSGCVCIARRTSSGSSSGPSGDGRSWHTTTGGRAPGRSRRGYRYRRPPRSADRGTSRGARWRKGRRDAHQEQDGDPEQHAVVRPDEGELVVMADPVDASDHEADRIGQTVNRNAYRSWRRCRARAAGYKPGGFPRHASVRISNVIATANTPSTRPPGGCAQTTACPGIYMLPIGGPLPRHPMAA